VCACDESVDFNNIILLSTLRSALSRRRGNNNILCDFLRFFFVFSFFVNIAEHSAEILCIRNESFVAVCSARARSPLQYNIIIIIIILLTWKSGCRMFNYYYIIIIIVYGCDGLENAGHYNIIVILSHRTVHRIL